MIDVKYYCNVARVMGILPRPTPKCTLCTLDDDRAETLDQIPIISISGKDGDYHDEPDNR